MTQTTRKRISPLTAVAHLAVAVLLAGPTYVAASGTLLLDTFDDDVVGQPPNGPEIGTYLEIVGDHVVVDSGSGDLALLTSGDGISGGPVLRYDPVGSPSRFTIEFELNITGGGVPVGQNAFSQTLVFDECAVDIGWADDGQVYLAVSFFAGVIIHETSFDWEFDSGYTVSIDVDSYLDTLSLMIDSSPVQEELQLPVDISELLSFAFQINEPTVGSHILDRLSIVDDSVLFFDGFESGDLGAWQ
jgi:hypothetical protein